MAKKNQVQPVEVASTVKKPLKVASTAKKTSEEDVSTAKKNKQSEPLENRSPESSNDDDEESDSSSDEEDEPTNAESESESYETEPASTKTLPPATVSTSASRNKKRQSEEAASTDVKRAKTAKKGTFERVWTENDEIVLLQGMIDFKKDTGKSPNENMSGFLQMVKKSISVDIKSGKQFSSKIWSLRRKYVGKRKNGVERSFTKPHDVRCLELAKTIWGTDKKVKLEDDSLKIDGTVILQQGWFERSFLVRAITDFGVMVDEKTVKNKWGLVPVETKKRLEEKFMSLQATQLKCVFQKTELLNEVSHVMAKVD